MVAPTDLMNTLITVNVSLGGVPVPRAGFGTVMLLSPQCSPASGLVLTYSSATAATALAADLGAGRIDAKIKTAVELGFAQARRPATIKVGKVPALATGAGPSTLGSTDLPAIVAEDNDFYGICLDCSGAGPGFAPMSVADQELNAKALAAWAETVDKLYLANSYDPVAYTAPTTDLGSELKALSYEHTAVVWSQLVATSAPGTAWQWIDLAALCRWLAFGPDDYSAPFRAPLTGVLRAKVTATFADLSAAEIAYIQGKNTSLGLLYGSAACFLDQGVNCNGREWLEVLCKHWLKARIREDLADIAVDRAVRGLKFPLSSEGVAICSAVVARRLQQGQNLGHFSAFSVGAATVDTATKTITLAANATILGNARSFTFNIDFLH